jgi:ferritin-like metal-binding protein YciE
MRLVSAATSCLNHLLRDSSQKKNTYCLPLCSNELFHFKNWLKNHFIIPGKSLWHYSFGHFIKAIIMETQTIKPIEDSKLREFFLYQLHDIYWTEKKLVKRLPKLQKAATSLQLKETLENQLSQTNGHIERLNTVFSFVDEEAGSKKSAAMAGIAEESKDIIDETDEGSAQRDVGIIFAIQKAVHYKIATYGGLAQLAKTLGYIDAKKILGETVAEEKRTDELFSQIAESGINYKAALEEKEYDI